MANNEIKNNENVPLCRCRVLYIGSAVPTVTKDGLQGIQQPLKERYSTNESTETKGINSWLTVWSNGLLLEYIDGTKRTESAFFPIVTLHYCAAVRYVNVSGFSIEGGGERFIPLDTPFAHIPDSPHPPIFAAIFRRTSGIKVQFKVLECHAFICTNENSANALVRCCFHSYGDTIYHKMDEKIFNNFSTKALKETNRSITPNSETNYSEQENNVLKKKNTIDELQEGYNWIEKSAEQKTWSKRQQNGEYDTFSIASSLFKKSTKKKKKFGTKSKNNANKIDGTVMLFKDRQYDGKLENYDNNYYEANNTINECNPYSVFDQNVSLNSLPNSQSLTHFSSPSSLSNVPINNINIHTQYGTPISQTFLGLNAPFLRHSRPFVSFPPYLPQNFGLPPFLLGKPISYLPTVPSRCVFMVPPSFNPNFFPHSIMNHSLKPSFNNIINGNRPIITESVYETFPRYKSIYDEPIYVSSLCEGLKTCLTPSYSNYKTDSLKPENCESFYDNNQKKKNLHQKSESDSDNSENFSNTKDESNKQFWKSYETNIYRKSNISEKAFAQTLNNTESKELKKKFKTQKNNLARPSTPPADYDQETSHQNSEINKI